VSESRPLSSLETADPVATAGVGNLIAAAEAALAEKPHQRTVLVQHQGRHYVAKRLAERPRRLLQTLLMRCLVKRVTGQPLPLRTLALSDAAHSMNYEAHRLAMLEANGRRVPHVMHHSHDYILLDHRGPTVARLLEKWPQETWRRELPRLARKLGTFHASGHWHGGAQIKNVTLQDGHFTRIDFEENFGEFLPLEVAQTVDLLLFLNSVSLAGPLDETESRFLLPVLLAEYVSVHPDNAVMRDTLLRSMPWFRLVSRLGRPFRRLTRKSLLRIEILLDVLDGFLRRP
jgi:tRNA A-37 threonylcarbamoyl transferase component Bud32